MPQHSYIDGYGTLLVVTVSYATFDQLTDGVPSQVCTRWSHCYT